MGRQTCLSASLQRRRQLQVHPGSACKRQTGTHPDAAARGDLLPPRHPGGFRPALLVFKGEKPKTETEKAALGDKILFSPDAVHPYTDTGHQLYLEAVVRSLARIEKAGTPGSHALPTPFVADNWEAAEMIPLSQAKLSPGWRRLHGPTNSLARSFGNRLPEV